MPAVTPARPDDPPDSAAPSTRDAFEAAAGAKEKGALSDFWAFLRENKKWWLTPIIVVLLLVAVLVVLAASGAAPFLYPLF